MKPVVRRWLSGALPIVILLIAPTGCYVPVRSESDRAAVPSVIHKRSEHMPGKYIPGDSSSVHRLTVNGDTIEAVDMWQGLHADLSAKATTLSPDAYRSYVEQRAAQLITDKIAEALLYQRASLRITEEMKKNIDKHVDREIRRIVTTGHDGIQRRYEKHLETQGQTLDQAREKLCREIIIAAHLEQEVRPRIAEPTRAELMSAFQAVADSFRRPPRRSMSLIDVRLSKRLPEGVVNPTPDQLQAARAESLSRIRAARNELQSGVDFAEVARRYSDGLHADEGGSWGWVSQGSVRERFTPALEVLYRLNAGEVSDIIETEDGFFLVRCDELDPGLEPDFESLQPDLKERYFRVAYNQLISDLVAELRDKARIEPANLERFHAAVVEAGLHIGLDLLGSDTGR